MNHQEAENTKATERYLLREMTDEERMAFEDHYLDCAQCLEAVTFGADFLDSGHELAEEKGVQQLPAVPWYDRMFSALRPMLKPAPAIALTAAVALAAFSAYQQKRITNQQNLIADLKAPSQEFRYVVSGAQRRGSNAILLSRNERLSLLINFVPKHEFTSYRAEITGPGLPTGYSVPVAVTEQDYSVMVSLPAAVLTGGEYQVNFLGRVEGGEETKLVSNSFEVKLKN
ncbi:MAG TPA: zf-HC2 domain-containing protein [Candidatus Angelobacter sp.]|nr:zf-HC2 domain-containing protein [Candidatus Angelobacter sp.]